VLVDLVAERRPCLRRHRVQGGFDTVREVDVVEATAARAHEVVMMSRELLGHLEAGHPIGGGQPGHDPAALEHAQVAVEGALGPVLAVAAQQLGDGERPARTDQRGDEGATSPGVALPALVQAISDERVRVLGHPVSVGEARGPAAIVPLVRLRSSSDAVRRPPVPEAPLPRSRTRRGVLLGIVASIVLAACATGPAGPLATVDGVEIPRDQLEGWVRTAVEANPSIDPVGLQAELLSWTIQTRILERVLIERGLEVDPALIDEIRESISDQVGGPLSLEATLADVGFPRDFFENVFLLQQAIIDTLAIELAVGRTIETRTARHILVETSEEADEVYALLLDGADFGELARERSQDAGSGAAGGVLGARERGVFVPPFDDAVWSAPLDTVLEPVESDFGFHVIEVIGSATLSAADLDSRGRQDLVMDELSTIVDAAFTAAVVSVDPTIGNWDAVSSRVLPVGRSN
jgi:peptidyl-prolyl cis-trans isomerase C